MVLSDTFCNPEYLKSVITFPFHQTSSAAASGIAITSNSTAADRSIFNMIFNFQLPACHDSRKKGSIPYRECSKESL